MIFSETDEERELVEYGTGYIKANVCRVKQAPV